MTFGGGMTIENGSALESFLALKQPDSTQTLYHLSSTSEGLYAFEISLIIILQ